MRPFVLIAWLLCAAALAALPTAGCELGDSVEKGCKTREDCPRPDRQTCQVETGVCIGFTSLPGHVDGGDAEDDLDASVP